MDFELSTDQKVARDFARDAVKREIAPKAALIDQEHRIPDELIKTMGELGFFGSYFSEDYGGSGLDFISYSLLVEEISKACGSTGVLISAHTSLCCAPIYQFGNEKQKKQFLPPLTSGEKIGCLMLTEPDAGSDVSAITTGYVKTEQGYELNGNKIFITNGGFLGTAVVFATKDKSLKHRGLSAFVLDLSLPGVELISNENKLGIRGSYTSSIALDKVVLPHDNLLGEEGDGFKIAMETLNGGRIGIASQALGIAVGAFDLAIQYSKQRKQFGTPIADFQAIQFKLADMSMRIEAARLITRKAAWLKQSGKNHAQESAMSKTIASECASYVTDEAIQIHGGYGYIEDYQVERMYRDARITRIYEGTNEIQRIVIAKNLLKD